MHKLSKHEQLEIIESLLEMAARKETEIVELKAQLDVFKPKDVDLQVIDSEQLKGKVLLFFRSSILREILKTMFDKQGSYDVQVLDHNEDLQSAFSIYNPDVCIIEHGELIEISDYSKTILELRALSKSVGIISVLSNNDVDVIREVVSAGVDDFLVKPIDTRRMIHVIVDIMQKKANRKAS